MNTVLLRQSADRQLLLPAVSPDPVEQLLFGQRHPQHRPRRRPREPSHRKSRGGATSPRHHPSMRLCDPPTGAAGSQHAGAAEQRQGHGGPCPSCVGILRARSVAHIAAEGPGLRGSRPGPVAGVPQPRLVHHVIECVHEQYEPDECFCPMRHRNVRRGSAACGVSSGTESQERPWTPLLGKPDTHLRPRHPSPSLRATVRREASGGHFVQLSAGAPTAISCNT